ncbi:hypothetical protein UPYG_G00069470 [Umbra pygmaea]|uniref:Uncharacterized protein n=1 Tax=Umbra pygmaea TaxID=75934 RepID=A0ABD0XB84_UMBPY
MHCCWKQENTTVLGKVAESLDFGGMKLIMKKVAVKRICQNLHGNRVSDPGGQRCGFVQLLFLHSLFLSASLSHSPSLSIMPVFSAIFLSPSFYFMVSSVFFSNSILLLHSVIPPFSFKLFCGERSGCLSLIFYCVVSWYTFLQIRCFEM